MVNVQGRPKYDMPLWFLFGYLVHAVRTACRKYRSLLIKMSAPYFEKGSVKAEDQEYLVRRAMLRGYQYTSLVTPPIYIAYTFARKRNLTVNRVLRATWVGGVIGTQDIISLVLAGS